MSALPPKAYMCSAPAHVRFEPIADIRDCAENALSWISDEHSNARHGAAFKPRICRATAASTVASLYLGPSVKTLDIGARHSDIASRGGIDGDRMDFVRHFA